MHLKLRRRVILGVSFVLVAVFGASLLAYALVSLSTPAVAQADPLTRFLDGIFKQQRPQQPQQVSPRRQPQRTPARAARPRRAPAPAPVVVRDQPQEAKPAADTFILVMGDFFAESLADGLRDAFAEMPTIEVSRNIRPNSGLVRDDHFDWPKAARERLADGTPLTIGVIMIGANDRQVMRDGDTSVEFGTDRWRELYGARIDAVEAAFAAKQIPLIWVGMPPMQGTRYSADVLSLNALIRDRAVKADSHYVDLWEAFSNDDNRFTASGPDINGQQVRLRNANGINFTDAGARKAAHFVELEIRRLLTERNSATVLALPPSSGAPADTAPDPSSAKSDDVLASAFPALPEQPGALVLQPPPPIAGPILPLTRREMAAGGQLARARPALSGYSGQLIERVYGMGRVPEPRVGRSDDFHWPEAEGQ
ncbi:SGNH_hydro domain-containing protein [Hyphomicrobiales bacterium]|nr:SGNH_hydro domain-containing protein [Hyphomicrobiales bacterium]CAH1672265.1 SGNH_hydro domain-containing protein [Hyphomicrobiales bacterium]